MAYVDGFVVPLPKENIDKYRDVATKIIETARAKRARFRDELNAQPVPWQELAGPHQERLAAAVAATASTFRAYSRIRYDPGVHTAMNMSIEARPSAGTMASTSR